MEFLHKNKLTLLIVLVIILLLTNFSSCYKNILTNKESKRVIEVYEQNIVALNDSIKKVVDKNGDTVFVEKAVHGNLNDIINSSAFKQLSKEKQQFYLELQQVKRVVAAAQVTITSQQTLINSLQYNANTVVTDSNVCFTKGDSLIFKDSTKSFQYQARIMFGDSAKFTLTRKNIFNVTTTFQKNKDKAKTITVIYKIDDPDAVVIAANSFVYNPEDNKTRFEVFLMRNGMIFKIAIPVATFAAGTIVGVRLLK